MPWVKKKKKNHHSQSPRAEWTGPATAKKEDTESKKKEETQENTDDQTPKKKSAWNDKIKSSVTDLSFTNILVIDDEEDFLDLYETVLEPLKIFKNIIKAHDGSMGLKKLQNQEFGLIILDLGMPKMNGIRFLEALNSKEFQKILKSTPPIILVTGKMDADVAPEILKYKIKHILAKPFNKNTLVQKVMDVINEQI